MNQGRLNILSGIITFSILIIIIRLFYWQVIASDDLAAQAEKQHYSIIEVTAHRGEIRSRDNYPLVVNKEAYLVFAYLPQLKTSISDTAEALAPLLYPFYSQAEATPPAELNIKNQVLYAKKDIENKLSRDDVVWVPLVRNSDLNVKKKIEEMDLSGIGTELTYRRDYPEASMAAGLMGFVGDDKAGKQKGYFGIEGYYDFELKGKPGVLRQERDASGKPILIGQFEELRAHEGRHLILHLDRAIQRIVESKLKTGIKKYGAKRGEVIVLDPQDGAVLSMASFPNYDPRYYQRYDESSFKNPSVSEFYEPGSTFKIITMAAALDSGAVKEDTRCEVCDGPLRVGSYSIGTWDDKYYPNSTMREVLEHSDNVGMVYAVSKLGQERLIKYLRLFGIGEETGIDLEEESTPILRADQEWKEIDLATAAFGQGIAVTGIQMTRAAGAIANQGILLTPRVVNEVVGDKVIEIEYQKGRRVISEKTAAVITDMMVNSVENGEAKWAKPKGHMIAGKTGTSQIPVAGHYDEEKTIASFIGFAPAHEPKFVMLVKLREPESSPWGSETAAPLWFSIAEDLLLYYGIQPTQ